MTSRSSILERVTLRIGRIRYTNALPFYHGLFQAHPPFDFEFFEDCPANINLAMHEGKIDIAPISSLEYLNHQEDYCLLPDLAIGSRDFSGSVLLLSKEKIEGLDKTRIALSRESLSSAALLKVLLKVRYKLENQFVTSDSNPGEMLAKNRAALVIGDDALFYQPTDFVFKYDLSELWWNWTEKPFCFAVWAVRREFAENYRKETAAFYRALRRNLDRNLGDLEMLVREALHMSFIDKRFPQIFGYLFNLIYGLDAEMRDGLELFYRMAHRLGLSPVPKKPEFFEGG